MNNIMSKLNFHDSFLYVTRIQTGSSVNLVKALISLMIFLTTEIGIGAICFSDFGFGYEAFIMGIIVFITFQVPLAAVLLLSTKQYYLYRNRRSVTVYKIVGHNTCSEYRTAFLVNGYYLISEINADTSPTESSSSVYAVKTSDDYISLIDYLENERVLISDRWFKWDIVGNLENTDGGEKNG